MLIISVYKSKAIRGIYLAMPQGLNIDSLPSELITNIGGIEYVMTTSITKEKPLFICDFSSLVNAIESRGYLIKKVSMENIDLQISAMIEREEELKNSNDK